MIWVFLHFVSARLVRNSVILSSDSRERRCLVYLGLIDGMFAKRRENKDGGGFECGMLIASSKF